MSRGLGPRRPAVLLAAALVLAGCASSGQGRPNGIDSTVRQQLRNDLTTLATAASAHRRADAEAALSALDADAAAAHVAGKIDDISLSRIRAAAARVHADLITARTVTPTVTVPASSPPPKPSRPKKDNGGDKHGKGHGDGGDGGGD